jgi:hypothetical protein
VSPVHNNNNVEKMLAGGTGCNGCVFDLFATPTNGSGKKNNDGSGCRSAAHGTADPDGTGWDGRRKICQL